MIEKFLIRFCAPEVRTMIARLHERPDDFTYGSRWRDLAEMRQGFTWAERKVLDKEWTKYKKNQKRRDLLGLINNEVLNPTPKERGLFGNLGFAGISANNISTAQVRAQMNAMQGQYASQLGNYNDAQSLFQGGNRNV
jgi:hypothetical protein